MRAFVVLGLMAVAAPAFAEETAAPTEPCTRFEASAVALTDKVGFRTEYGLQTTTTPAGWRFGLAADVVRVPGYQVLVGFAPPLQQPVYATVPDLTEIDLGGRARFTDTGIVRPWVGAGVAGLLGGGNNALGPWLGFGLSLYPVQPLVITVQSHFTTAHADPYSLDYGGTGIGGSLGVSF